MDWQSENTDIWCAP